MAVKAGPDNEILNNTNVNGLVTDSLVLFYDAGRKFSYGGSGGTWTDLSGNGRHLTMYNAGGSTYSVNPSGPPTFTEDSLGVFTFDGNDFGKFSSYTAGSNVTLSVWCKTTNNNRENGILSHCSGGPVNLGYSINAGKMKYWYYDTQWRTASGTASVNDGNWKYLVWAKSGTSMTMYINGVSDSTHTLNTNVSGSLVSIGSLWGPCNSDSYGAGSDNYGQCFIGSMALIKLYGKTLTAPEITQNYNNTKRRFGL